MKLFRNILKRGTVSSVHESHRPIRLKKFLAKVVVNFGGTHDLNGDIIINPPRAIRMSIDKVFMKGIFRYLNVSSCGFGDVFDEATFPMVLKSKRHIKSYPHLTKVNNKEELDRVLASIVKRDRFYWESFVPFDREFRVHVSHYKIKEVFATEKIQRERSSTWIRNKDNSVFKKDFTKPDGWENMLDDCHEVLKYTNIDIAGFDIGYSAARKQFYIIEVNTACGMGPLTVKAYTKELNRIAIIKHFGL